MDFLPFVAHFGFLYQQIPKASNVMLKWKYLKKKKNKQQKSQNKQPKAFACFGFETELILSQKQERAKKNSNKQRTANGNTPQKQN